MKSALQRCADVWLFDVGNSKIEAQLYRGGREVVHARIATRDATAHAVGVQLAAALAQGGGLDGVPVLLASVQPKHARWVEQALRRAGATQVHHVSWRDPWPFAIGIAEPATVGVDRLANVAGLVALGMQRGIAVDVGTAITIDVLSAGVFQGGLILPGFELCARSLHAHTALLPLVDASSPAPEIGRSTEEALRSGVHQLLVRGVGAITACLAEPDVPVVYTGGQGDILASALGARLEPTLLFCGLRLLAARLASPGSPGRN